MLMKKALLGLSLALAFAMTGCGTMVAPIQHQTSGGFSARSIQAFDEALDRVAVHQKTDTNSAKFFVDGTESFEALEALIRSAKQSIYAEYFIWRNDTIGKRIADLLIEKKQQGLDVKVLIDPIGSKEREDKKILERFKAAGVEARHYPMLNVFGEGRLGIAVTHRKLMCVDGWRVMTGGINMGDEYHRATGYHDLMTLIEGPAGHDMFLEWCGDWQKAGGSTPQHQDPIGYNPSFGAQAVRIAVTSTFQKDRATDWQKVLFAAIDRAQSEICIESPYFSDDDLLEHLTKACRRGVKVRVIVAVARNDDDMFKRLNVESARQLMKEGAEFKTYLGTRFSHTKYLCIDDSWTVLGSANCDARSFHDNQELVAAVSGSEYASEAQRRIFETDWVNSRKMGTLKSNSMKHHLWNDILEIIDYYL